ncbi:UNVERIFIED_ORG: hypothetical protein M2216_002621 [Bradyrhizobium japonicum]
MTTAAILSAHRTPLDQHQPVARNGVSLKGARPQPHEERPMREAWKMFCLSAVTFAAALGLAQLLVPDIVPVAFAEEPQGSWAVMTAFVLRAIELIAAAVAIIALAVLAGAYLQQELRRLFRSTSSRRAPPTD